MTPGVQLCGHEYKYMVSSEDGTSFCWMCEFKALEKGELFARVVRQKRLDNQVKAILDAAQGLVFENDLWIDSISAERRLGSQTRAQVVVLPQATHHQNAQKGTKVY